MKRYEVTVNGQVYEVSLRELADGETVEVSQPAAPATEKEMNANAAGGGIQVKAPSNVWNSLVYLCYRRKSC